MRSIAALPFEPLGNDTHDELLGLGMADAIIGRTSNLKQLSVLPTSAVSKYKGPANDPLDCWSRIRRRCDPEWNGPAIW